MQKELHNKLCNPDAALKQCKECIDVFHGYKLKVVLV